MIHEITRNDLVDRIVYSQKNLLKKTGNRQDATLKNA